MRKLQRQIKRNFLDGISPGNKPDKLSRAMRYIARTAEFKAWREQLAKNAREWRSKNRKAV